MWKFLKVMLVMFIMITFTSTAFACNQCPKEDAGLSMEWPDIMSPAGEHQQVLQVAVNYLTNQNYDLPGIANVGTGNSIAIQNVQRSPGVLRRGLTVREFKEVVSARLLANRKSFEHMLHDDPGRQFIGSLM